MKIESRWNVMTISSTRLMHTKNRNIFSIVRWIKRKDKKFCAVNENAITKTNDNERILLTKTKIPKFGSSLPAAKEAIF